MNSKRMKHRREFLTMDISERKKYQKIGRKPACTGWQERSSVRITFQSEPHIFTSP